MTNSKKTFNSDGSTKGMVPPPPPPKPKQTPTTEKFGRVASAPPPKPKSSVKK
jgi:hypothetical protein